VPVFDVGMQRGAATLPFLLFFGLDRADAIGQCPDLGIRPGPWAGRLREGVLRPNAGR